MHSRHPSTFFLRLACAESNPAKRAWEVFNLKYAVFWVGCFAAIIGFDLYEEFNEVFTLTHIVSPLLLVPDWLPYDEI